LMIVVAIIGILAAIAIPAFIEYINSGKGTEADLNLNKIAKSAKIYRQKNSQFVTDSEGPIPATSSCLAPNRQFSVGQFLTDRAATGAFQQMDFVVADAFRYQYTYTGGADDFTADATGDLDCDGTTKSNQAVGDVDPQGNPQVLFTTTGTD
jgi:type IV pilus assembly protein PilA